MPEDKCPRQKLRKLQSVPLPPSVFELTSLETPLLRSVVVRASARGAGGRGSIPDRVTPKT